MNKITQHIPGFIDAERHVAEFATVDELREIDWVTPWITMTPGNYLAQSGELLMVVSSDGKWWWVIGYLQIPLPFDQLPPWASADTNSDHP